MTWPFKAWCLCAKLQEFGKNLPFFSKFYICIWSPNYPFIRNLGITDHEILPQAYTTYREDRSTPGGGVFLAISCNLPSRQIPSPENLEVVLYVSLFLLMILMPLFVWCMHPQMLQPSITLIFQTIWLQLLYHPTQCLYTVVGDFNLPDINWSTLSSISSVSSNFCKFKVQFNPACLIANLIF